MTSRAGTRTKTPTTPAPAVPRPMAGTIERPRLEAVLADAVHRPLTVLSAPAGYGKSVLVSAWAQQQGPELHLAYLSMQESDEAPAAFWVSARQALRDSGLEVPDTAWVPMVSADDPGVDPVARSVLRLGRPVVWVIDCNEFQLSPGTGKELNRLLGRCSGALRLVLVTRADPPLPLHRHRLAGTITEIRAAELAFTTPESTALMAQAGIALGRDDLLMLRSRTAGWPAGLRFAAMTIAGRADVVEAVADFRGDTGNVAAYLMSEVYARQPGMIRQFLLHTCVADTLDPTTVTALTGQPCDDRALEFLTGGNSFIERVPGARGTYRYQSLFREFLRSQLAYEDPELERELRRAMAGQLAAGGKVVAAVQHAVAAEDWLLASHLLVDGRRFGSLLAGGQRSLLRTLLAGMPPTTPGPAAAVVRAAVALGDYDRIRCARHLQEARDRLRADTTTSGRACSLAISVLEAIRASLGPDHDEGLRSSLSAENALDLAAEEDLAVPADLVALVSGSKARVQFMRGDFRAARESWVAGLRAADTDPDLDDVGHALRGMLALTTALAGDLRQADAISTRLLSESTGHEHGAGKAAPAAIAALAWVRMEEYDLEAVEELLSSSEGSSPTFDARIVQPVLMLVRARLFSAKGDADLAVAVLDAARTRPATTGPAGWTDRALWHEHIAVLLRQGRAEEALALTQAPEGCGSEQDRLLVDRVRWALGEVDPAAPPPERASASAPAQSLGERVARELHLAEWSARQGDDVTGGEHVHRALGLAAPEHMRRPFHEAGDAVRSLLRRNGRWSRWLDRSTGSGSVGADEAPVGGLVDPLTKREREVLAHLADLLTTEEIADVMFVSVNTVRSHVRSVLRKLGASRRNEAVRRAWELGLLVPPEHGPSPVP